MKKTNKKPCTHPKESLKWVFVDGFASWEEWKEQCQKCGEYTGKRKTYV